MSKFQYLAPIIPFTFGVVLFITIVIMSIYWCKHRGETAIRQNYVNGQPFEVVYRGSLQCRIGAYWSMRVLLLWRVVCLTFFYAVPLSWYYIREAGGVAHYFTLWNIDLITAYFFLASLSSCLGIPNDQYFEEYKLQLPTSSQQSDPSFWSDALTKFGYAIQILYEVTGSTAFFITVVAFTTLNPDFTFWNVNLHFMTSMSLLVELSLNQMIVRWEHVLFTIYWALMYLIFIWPIVVTGKLHDWPYFFLKTDKASVFPWYIGLIAALMIFYYLFWFLSFIKGLILEKVEGRVFHSRSTVVVPVPGEP